MPWLKSVDQILRPIESADFDLSMPISEHRRQAYLLSLPRVLVHVLVWGFLSGAMVGSYGFVVGARSFTEQLPQMMLTGIKVPMLLALTVLVSLPSYYVINNLFGLRKDFAYAVRSIISAQAGLSIILFALSPIALFWYCGCPDENSAYQSAVLFDSFIFAVASLSGQVLLRNYYQPLLQQDRKHRWMIRAWILVYAFVGIQAAWVLRPFIGNPNEGISFFRSEPFGNAYVQVIRMIWQRLAG